MADAPNPTALVDKSHTHAGPPSSGEYGYEHAECGRHHEWLLPALGGVLANRAPPPRRIFDLGCGNGSVSNWLSGRGYGVCGVDVSVEGIRLANQAYPTLQLHVGSAYERLWETYGTFPVVVSLEVIEHVYAPRTYAACIFRLLEEGGTAVISTPYHGYLKNVALAITGKLDAHFTALWDHGHIKFWSPRTITVLLREAGLEVRAIHRVGRIPQLAKSMLVVATKPRGVPSAYREGRAVAGGTTTGDVIDGRDVQQVSRQG